MEKSGKYYASDNMEHYPVGPYNTKEEAITEYKKDYETDPKYIGVSREVFCTIDGQRVVENLANGCLYEELYEDALNDWCNFKLNDPRWATLSERLTEVFHTWLDEVKEEKSWAVIEEVTPAAPEGELDGTRLEKAT